VRRPPDVVIPLRMMVVVVVMILFRTMMIDILP
jgi:hypothetical protein